MKPWDGRGPKKQAPRASDFPDADVRLHLRVRFGARRSYCLARLEAHQRASGENVGAVAGTPSHSS
jgi:hypothetical protein